MSWTSAIKNKLKSVDDPDSSSVQLIIDDDPMLNHGNSNRNIDKNRLLKNPQFSQLKADSRLPNKDKPQSSTIVHPMTNEKRTHPTLDMFLNRTRNRTQFRQTDLKGEENRQKERNGREVIDVNARTTQQLKKKFFGKEYASTRYEQQLKAEAVMRQQARAKQEKQKREEQKQRKQFQELMRQQQRIIDRASIPNWMVRKNQQKERNQLKYPISCGVQNYQRRRRPNNGGFIDEEWNKFQKQQAMKFEKKKIQIQQRKREERQQQEKQRLQKEKQRQDDNENMFLSMLGIDPKKKVKPNQDDQPQEGLKNTELLQEVNQIDISNEDNNSLGGNSPTNDLFPRRKNLSTTLGEIAKNYASTAPSFIHLILAHNYSADQHIPQTKKIPDTFKEALVYRKVFHYLVINECIADVQLRMKKIEKQKSINSIKIQIGSMRANNDGMIEISLKQIKSDNEDDTIRNFSLSRYRIGLITNLKEFQLSNHYGVPSKTNNKSFAFLSLLITPQTKEDLSADVKAIASLKQSQLELIMKTTKSRQAYFYDLDKLSTHLREYVAISNLQYSDLAPMIFDPSMLQNHHKEFIYQRQIIDPLLQILKSVFNFTQFQSIRQMVLRENGIVLLQGPPGTGKTSTLMGLLSVQYEYLQLIGDTRKIMICAPSNAAVDHITKRIITEGLINNSGDKVVPRILRVGIVQTDDPDIKSASLDQMCDKKMIELQQEVVKGNKMTTPQIKQKIIDLQKQVRILGNELQNGKRMSDKQKKQKQDQLKLAKQTLVRFENMLFDFRKQKFVINRKTYNQIESSLIQQSEIILTTLSSSGNDKVQKLRGEIACLIVDEAAQATQPNLLIALQTGVEKVLMIGDPYQLPATCMSPDSNVTLFNRSLFQRFIDANIKPYFLNIQYRMAPLIRTFPSRQFYQNRLIDSEGVIQRGMPQSLREFDSRNVIFMDVKDGTEKKVNDSYSNFNQAKVIQSLIMKFLGNGLSIGVITPYQSQKKLISRMCMTDIVDEQKRELFLSSVMINTIDSFQGQQKDVILVSTVRSNRQANVGFLLDERRINVTLTRSKYLLVVVGNGDTLGGNQIWDKFLEWVQCGKEYFEIKSAQDIDRISKGQNTKKISRVKHEVKSKDTRKYQRNEIQSNDFLSIKKSKSKANYNPSIQDSVMSRSNSNRQQTNFMRPPQQKYALDIAQSHKIVEEKRKKQQQMHKFEEANNRLQEMENQLRKDKDNDDFLKQLFM